MRIFTHRRFLNQTRRFILIPFALLTLSLASPAQSRPYAIVYSENIRGTSTMIGNTLMNIVDNGSVNTFKMNENAANGNGTYANDNQNMQYTDIDGSTGPGSVTRNSSSADLALPAGTNNIKLARLYWGGRVNKADFNLAASANKKVKIRKGTTGDYSDITALGIDTIGITGSIVQYQAYADVTALIATGGSGTYMVGNVPLSIGAASNGGNNGGWCIVVVYENPGMDYKSIRVYDGFEQVFTDGNAQSTTVTLSGLDVPSGVVAMEDAKMGVLAWEGDANLTKDFLKINGNIFSNATNQADNPWNGTITDNGVYVTAKNPNFTNQMGIDIDQFNVGTGYGIASNASLVTLEFGTQGDKYFPGLFTFAISMKDPTINLINTVADDNDNKIAEKNEVLTYTIKGKNNGAGNANSIEINDTLPSSVTYVPNSLRVISSPGVEPGVKTDQPADDNAEYIVNGAIKTVRFRLGKGWTSDTGGMLAPGESYEVQFQVTVNDPGAGKVVPSIMNVARIKAASDAHVDFVDDGTAIINPNNGPLPVTFLAFSAFLHDQQVTLNWATSMEINCREYQVERSVDGRFFTEVATVAGNGTTYLMHSYSAIDDVSFTSGSIVYYRLKQVDIDNKENYSKILAVKIKEAITQINISPIPFASYLNINIEWGKSELITTKVINTEGKELISKNIQMNKGLNYISINDLSKLPAGNYFIQFISAGEKITEKVTKQ